MATTFVEGTDGAITFATGYSVCPTAWTVNFAAEDVETTCLGDAWKTRIAGLKEWGGTFTTRLTTSLSGWSSEAVGLSLGTAAASVTFTAISGTTIAGSIIVTGADVSLAIGGAAGEISFTFVGTGVPTTVGA